MQLLPAVAVTLLVLLLAVAVLIDGGESRCQGAGGGSGCRGDVYSMAFVLSWLSVVVDSSLSCLWDGKGSGCCSHICLSFSYHANTGA